MNLLKTLLLVALLANFARSVEGQALYGVFSYWAYPNSSVICGYSGPGGTVTIPGMIAGWPVAIGSLAFVNSTNISNVILYNGATAIQNNAFQNCINLTNVIIPGSVTNIGPRAFMGCSQLRTVDLGSGLASIGYSAFQDCTSLSGVVIPDLCSDVELSAFYNCTNLQNAVIGNGLATLGTAVFENCSALTNLTLGTGLTNITSVAFENCVRLKRVIVPKAVRSVGDYAFYNCTNLNSVVFLGNAPTTGYESFGYDTSATVYYLPSTTGWSANFGGLPAMLWNPQMQTGTADFGMRTNRFGFRITGTGGLKVTVEAATNLSKPVWLPVLTNTLTGGTAFFSDAQTTNFNRRFYRIPLPQ